MPEGDTIYRTAVTLRAALVNRVVEDAISHDPHVDATQLQQRRVLAVEPRGKHLLVDVGGCTIHSHLGMKGAWRVYAKTHGTSAAPRQAALVLRCRDDVASVTVACFQPKLLELLSPTALRRHAWLSQLGPDLLDSQFDGKLGVGRLQTHGQRAIGEVLLDQSVICGIGNVYKSEMLFLTGIHPFCPVDEVADERLLELLDMTRRYMLRNLEGQPRRTRFRDGPRLWVYERRGERCLRCGERIERATQGSLARSSYWCPGCQPAPGSPCHGTA